jgi:hypothetical protein
MRLALHKKGLEKDGGVPLGRGRLLTPCWVVVVVVVSASPRTPKDVEPLFVCSKLLKLGNALLD